MGLRESYFSRGVEIGAQAFYCAIAERIKKDDVTDAPHPAGGEDKGRCRISG